MLQAPPAVVVAVPRLVVPSSRVIVLEASAVPVTVNAPSVSKLLLAGAVMTGARGGVVSVAAAGVNAQLWAARRVLPARSLAAVLIVAVYDTPATRLALGSSVTTRVAASYDTVAITAAPPAVGARLTLVVVRLAAVIASEKVAVTLAPTAMLLAPAPGTVLDTSGRTVSTVIVRVADAGETLVAA